MSGVTSLNTLTGVVGLTSGNPLIGVGTTANNVVVTALASGITGITVQGQTPQDPLTSGQLVFVPGTNVTMVTDSLSNTLTINSTGGGSSITAGGATVACDAPAASGSITLTTTASGSAGNVTIDTTAASTGNVTMNASGVVDINASGSGAGARITTATTVSRFEGTSLAGGVAGQVYIVSSDATNPATFSVGGAVNNTGLYVSNSQLLFNGSAVGSGGSSITGGGATVACNDPAATGSITLTTTATGSAGNVAINTSAGTTGDISLTTGSGNLSLTSSIGNVQITAQQLDINTNDSSTTGTLITTATTVSQFEGTAVGGVAGQVSFVSSDSTNPARLSVGGAVNNTGLYVSNAQLLFNGNALGGGNWSYKGVFNTTTPTAYALNDVVFDLTSQGNTYLCILAYTTASPYTPPSTNVTNWILFASNTGSFPNELVRVPNTPNNEWTSGVYDRGAVVYSPTAPNNWFICYVPVGAPGATDPQADVNAGSFGQGVNWQLLAPAGFTTTTGTTPGTYYGSLTLSGTAITSTNLTTGAVVIDAGLGNMVFSGTWLPAPYPQNSVVQYGGTTWVSVSTTLTSDVPTLSSVVWKTIGAVANAYQSGSNVTGYTSAAAVSVSSTLPPQLLITLASPLPLSSLTYGGGVTSFTGTVGFTLSSGTKTGGDVTWIGVQLFDTTQPGSFGNVGCFNSSDSVSSPVYFLTPIPITTTDGLTSYTSELFTASIKSLPGTASAPNTKTFSLGMVLSDATANILVFFGATFTGRATGAVTTDSSYFNSGTF